MYCKLDEKEIELIKKIGVITWGDYELQEPYIEVEMLKQALEELMYSYEELNERYKDLEKDVEENYKPIPIDLGLSEKDFY